MNTICLIVIIKCLLKSITLVPSLLTDLTRLQSSSLTFICLSSISFSGWIRDVVGEFSLQSRVVTVFIGSKIFNTLSALAISSSDNVYTSFAFCFQTFVLQCSLYSCVLLSKSGQHVIR